MTRQSHTESKQLYWLTIAQTSDAQRSTDTRPPIDTAVFTASSTSSALNSTPVVLTELAAKVFHLSTIVLDDGGLHLYYTPAVSSKRVRFAEQVEVIPPPPRHVVFAEYDEVHIYDKLSSYTAHVRHTDTGTTIDFETEPPPSEPASSLSSSQSQSSSSSH